MSFEDPEVYRAFFTEKLGTGFTKVSNVLEIELAFAVRVLACLCLVGS